MQLRESYQQKSESASVILLLIVFFTLIRPVAPMLTDNIAHRYFMAQHEQLHKLSLNHLDDDLKNANDANTATKQTKTFEQILIYCIEITTIVNFTNTNIIAFEEPKFFISVNNAILTIQPPDAAMDVCPDENIQSVFFI